MRPAVPFDEGSIAVYAGTVTIPDRVGRDAGAGLDVGTTVAVEVQACNDAGRCLAAATAEQRLRSSPGSWRRSRARTGLGDR